MMPVLIYIIITAISGCTSGSSPVVISVADEGALWQLFGGLLILGGIFLFGGRYDLPKDHDRDELYDDENSRYEDSRWLGGDK